MKTQSAALIAEQAKLSVTTFWLLQVGSYYFTDYHDNLVYKGDTYIPFPFKLPEGVKTSDGSTLDGGEIKLSSVDLTLASAVLNNTLKNAEVYIYEQWFDVNMTLIDTELRFAGKVDGRPSLNEMNISVTVAAHLNPWTQRFPRRRITKTNFPFILPRNTIITWGRNTGGGGEY